ncbi:MAG TPA: hypothetical protein VGQ09_13815 [Chitinophagaceae bacterium]|nr:hypothetical protein [Chitinophagaceae bacterium]
MKKLLGFAIGTFLFIACNNSGSPKENEAKSNADSLMNEVMEGHNVGMSKMSKLNEAQKKVQHAIDSLSKLPMEQRKNSTAYKMQLDSILDRLKYANYAMDRWMEEFNMDSASNNEEMRFKYLESEKIKIAKVNEAMLSSLQKADSLLKQKP